MNIELDADLTEKIAVEALKNSISEIEHYIQDNEWYHSSDYSLYDKMVSKNFIPIYSDIFSIEDKKLKKLKKHLTKVLEYYSPIKA